MELDGIEREVVGDLSDEVWLLIEKDADNANARAFCPHGCYDFRCTCLRDAAQTARRKVQSHHLHAGARAGEGIGDVGDAANFHRDFVFELKHGRAIAEARLDHPRASRFPR